MKQIRDENNQTTETTEAPSLEIEEKIVEISRDEAKNKNQRLSFENISIKGSISLKGAVIDDLIFKNLIVIDPHEVGIFFFHGPCCQPVNCHRRYAPTSYDPASLAGGHSCALDVRTVLFQRTAILGNFFSFCSCNHVSPWYHAENRWK